LDVDVQVLRFRAILQPPHLLQEGAVAEHLVRVYLLPTSLPEQRDRVYYRPIP
jgi:hypothetical protein